MLMDDRLTEVRPQARQILDEALFHLIRSPGEREQIVSYLLHHRVDIIGTKLHEIIERGLGTPPEPSAALGLDVEALAETIREAWKHKPPMDSRQLAAFIIDRLAARASRTQEVASNDEVPG